LSQMRTDEEHTWSHRNA